MGQVKPFPFITSGFDVISVTSARHLAPGEAIACACALVLCGAHRYWIRGIANLNEPEQSDNGISVDAEAR